MTMFGLIIRSVCFTIFSAVDLAFTLFHHNNQSLDEMNPVANAALQQGPHALCGFKAFTVAVVIAAATIIYLKKRPNTARWVLNFGVACMTLVFAYHLALLML